MRFMAIVKPGKDYEAGRPPSPGLMAAMGKLNEESTRAGIFVTGGGLLPSSQGHRLSMTGGKVTVTDGPFTETKEVIGGFAILNYASHEQAIEGARRVMQIHAEHGITELEIELRPMMDPAECGQVPQQEASAA
ncbi:MAG: hypothetical protein QOF14_2501 [Hyphomicrobiales bacterium]|jgi:hypothetical protein|nr:hypothetical protein [Hyphomicrobiales bacterium]